VELISYILELNIKTRAQDKNPGFPGEELAYSLSVRRSSPQWPKTVMDQTSRPSCVQLSFIWRF
jgi:hypothetical protein